MCCTNAPKQCSGSFLWYRLSEPRQISSAASLYRGGDHLRHVVRVVFWGESNFSVRKRQRSSTLHKFSQLGDSGGSSLNHHQHFWVLIDLKVKWLIKKHLGRQPPSPPTHKQRWPQARCWRRQLACQKPSQRQGTYNYYLKNRKFVCCTIMPNHNQCCE